MEVNIQNAGKVINGNVSIKSSGIIAGRNVTINKINHGKKRKKKKGKGKDSKLSIFGSIASIFSVLQGLFI